MTQEEKNMRDLVNLLLPPHPQGALGMLNAVKKYGIEQSNEKLVIVCNRELSKYN